MFEPILQDQPIEYLLNRKEGRNEPREKAWNVSPVLFFPPNASVDDYGQAGPHYERGKAYNVNYGYEGNCTYWIAVRYLILTGIILTECIGKAVDVFKKYKGRKSGGNFNGEYIGNTIQEGDILVFADDKSLSGDGHVIFVEKDFGDYFRNSEEAYSKKLCYRNKACIVYDLNKKDMITGRKISLRPQQPFSEILYGVIHTGDVFKNKDIDYKKLYEESQDKLERIKKIINA